MDLINVYFVFIFLTLSILFTVGAFIFRGMWWIAVVGGLLWMLLGLGSIMYAEVFYFQRVLSVVFIVVGIAVMFSPIWYKKKEEKTGAEILEDDDLGAYQRELKEYDESIGAYRRLGRRKYAPKK